MDKQILEKSGINYNEGLHRFSENAALYEKFLNKFLTDETMSKCVDAFRQEEYDDALRAAHTLKGTTGNLSMNMLSDKCAIIVNALRVNDYNNLDELFSEAQTAYNLVIEAIKA